MILSSTVVRDNALLAVDLTNPDLIRARQGGGAARERSPLPRLRPGRRRLSPAAPGPQLLGRRGRLRAPRSGWRRTSPTSSRCGARRAAGAGRRTPPEVHPRRDQHRLPRPRRRRCAGRASGADPAPTQVAAEGACASRSRSRPARSVELSFEVELQRGTAPRGLRRRSATRPPEATPSRRRCRRQRGARSSPRVAASTTGCTGRRPTCACCSPGTPHGLYPYAGVPWFSTPFGRDGIITALQTLWIKPEVARGVLRFLAATQATHSSAEARRRAGQDRPRDAPRRDGRPRRGALRPLLRQRRRDAALRGARRRVPRAPPATSR